MSLTLAIALYFVIWWTVLFAVLPFGVRTQDEDGTVVPGTPGSAPAKPAFLKIVLLNSLLSALVLGLIWFVIAKGWINLEALGPSPK